MLYDVTIALKLECAKCNLPFCITVEFSLFFLDEKENIIKEQNIYYNGFQLNLLF